MIAYGHVGDVLGFRAGEHLGDFAGAAEVLGKAVVIAEWLVRQDPSDERRVSTWPAPNFGSERYWGSKGKQPLVWRNSRRPIFLNAPLLRKNAANTLYLANSIVLKTTIAESRVALGRGNDAVRLARQAFADAEGGIASRLTTPSQVLHSKLGLAIVLAYANHAEETPTSMANSAASTNA